MLRWLRNFPLLFRTVIAVVVAVTAVLALFAYFGSDALDNSIRRTVGVQTQFASLAAASVQSRIAEIETNLLAATQSGEVLPSMPPAALLDRMVQLRLSSTAIKEIFILNAEGNPAAANPALPAEEWEAIRGDPAVGQALTSGQTVIGGFSAADGTTAPRFLLVVPIRDAANAVVGWLGAAVDVRILLIEDFGSLTASQPLSRVFLVDGGGQTVQITSDEKVFLQPVSYSPRLLPYLSKGTAQSITARVEESGVRQTVVISIAALKGIPWGFFIEQPESEINSTLYVLRWQFVFFGAGILALAILFAVFEQRLILVPIRELLTATRRLTAGDLTTTIPVYGRDETSELSKAFEMMRQRLSDWNAELSAAVERQTHKLSTLYAIDRVASRTLELEEILTVSLERVLEVTRMDAGGYFMAGEDGSLDLHVQSGLTPELAEALHHSPPGTGVAGLATAGRCLVIFPSPVPEEEEPVRLLRAAGFLTVVATPLIAKGRALGALVFMARDVRTFSAEDVDLLESIGQQLGSALHNANLFELEQRRRALAEHLYELGTDLITASTAAEAARIVATKVAQAELAHSAVVTLIDPNGQVNLRLGANAEGVLMPEPPPRPNGGTMQVFHTGKNLVAHEPDSPAYSIPQRLRDQGVQALIGIPLRTAERVIGTLFVRYRERRAFTDDQLRTLTTFVNTAATAIERAHLLEETRRRLEEVGALYDLSSVLRGSMTLAEMLPLVLQKAAVIVRADAANIALVEGEELVCRAVVGFTDDLIGRRVPIGQGFMGGVALTGETRQTPFLPSDPLVGPLHDGLAVMRGVGSTLCLPLRTADTVVGAMLLLSSGRSPFDENDLRLLTAVADIAGGSIHRAILFEQLEHRVHELASLYEFGTAVSTSLRLEEVVNLVLGSAPAAVRAQGGCLFLWDEIEEALVLWEAGPNQAERPTRVKYQSGEGLAGWVFIEKRPALVPDVSADPRWKLETETELEILGCRVRDAVAVPLIRGKRVLGVLMVFNRKGERVFTEADQSLLMAVAGQTAIAIENAMLFEDVRELSVEAISSLATAIDARDPYTRGHSEDVTRGVVELAKLLGWQGADLEMIEFAALLHDVGKIAVPDDILRKPNMLVPEEWDVVYLHPYHSAQIVRPVEPLRRIVPWIYHHHEHWDGSGYPDALRGENIPEAARIIAVVDAFNAITTDRPYHKALSEAEALAEIERHAGTQFDPKIAAAFLRMMRKENGSAGPESK